MRSLARVAGPPVTLADYLALHDDVRHEVVDGQLVLVPASETRHRRPVRRLGKSSSLSRSPCDRVTSPELAGLAAHQPRARHCGSDGRSVPSVVSAPCPG